MARNGGPIQKKTRGRRQRARPKDEDAGDDDEDEEYVVEDDEDGGESENSDESFVSEESESAELSEPRSEFDSDVEIKPRKAAAGRRRKRSGPPARRGRRRARASDEEDEEDEDFDPDEEEEVSPIPRRRSVLKPCPKKPRSKPSRKKGRKAKKERSGSVKTLKMRQIEKPWVVEKEEEEEEEEEEEDDDDFEVKDQMELEKRRRMIGSKRKRSAGDSDASDSDYDVSEEEEEEEVQLKKRPRGRPRKAEKRKRSRLVDSEAEFSDFVVSEEEKEVTGRDRPRKKKNERKKISESEDSESDYWDFVISEEELEDLGIGGVFSLPPQQPKRIFAGRKKEAKAKEKGKEKAEEDASMQVCGICLSEENKMIVRGVLDCCTHYFCFVCIMEWSKVESRCPVCKRRFETISKSGGVPNPGFGMRRAVIRVPKRDQVYQPSEEEMRGYLDPYEYVVCMECQQGGDDFLMLLCDICDSPAHTYCVGLGREVPDGNWYCEVCKPICDGSSHAQARDTVTEQGSGSSNPSSGFSCATGADYTNTFASSVQQSSHGLSLMFGIDLNVSPRYPWREEPESVIQTSGTPRHDHREEHESTPQVLGAGASTLSGRRAIQQRVRILFNRRRQLPSSTDVPHNGETLSGRHAIQQRVHTLFNRRRQLPSSTNMPHHGVATDVITSDVQQQGAEASPHQYEGLAQRNSSPPVHCSVSEGSSFQLVEGAKEEVQSLVKGCMKPLSKNAHLERSSFKDIARRSTHTILAACGIKHNWEMVDRSVLPPSTCSHYLEDGASILMKGCCSACFTSFVGSVVEKLVKEY